MYKSVYEVVIGKNTIVDFLFKSESNTTNYKHTLSSTFLLKLFKGIHNTKFSTP